MSNIPWVEKYRPTSIDHVIGHARIIATIKSFMESNAIPHFLFTGSAGTGKTSTAIALIMDIMRRDGIAEPRKTGNLLVINASEDNGVEETKVIKQFVFSHAMNTKKGYKFIVLDESDNISRDAQAIYRRIIETAPVNVKFIFICNYDDRLIDPILSRCSLCRFSQLPRNNVMDHLQHIIENEQISVETGVLDVIYNVTEGDMRSAINTLQTLAMLGNKMLLAKDVSEFFGVLPPKTLDLYIKALYDGNFTAIQSALQSIPEIFPRNFLMQIFKVFYNRELPIESKKKIIKAIARADYYIASSSDENIQLDGVSGSIARILHKEATI